MTYEWLLRRIDTDEAVFGPMTSLLLSWMQRRELIRLMVADRGHAQVELHRPCALLFRGRPVAVPRRDAYMGGVRA